MHGAVETNLAREPVALLVWFGLGGIRSSLESLLADPSSEFKAGSSTLESPGPRVIAVQTEVRPCEGTPNDGECWGQASRFSFFGQCHGDSYSVTHSDAPRLRPCSEPSGSFPPFSRHTRYPRVESDLHLYRVRGALWYPRVDPCGTLSRGLQRLQLQKRG
jgi:hypothetical protein